ncbi:ABC transporter permease [Campylobacter sp. MIT 97-5078]|uniref:ABC transporter permease n=1 Tax=Campylobacter sp. MIT 97-5078 TaxID=1548153 RepID=UPI000512B736|nr:FtsX-like permease family protein [Campylobacter sp. MIT 97-5078]KGI56121.1 membrane protein [Campylobacter sp. MIT 97-5078]KGI57105.1 membrane protein [Campylobacter sp. MIT 97-5078]TQR25486.1 ABC transporter permease [Campylobacter sp. MIT 97-5078]
MVNEFALKQLFKSLIFSYQRVFIMVLAIFLAVCVSVAFLNIYFDIDTKLSKELKAYGANLTILAVKEDELISNESYKKLAKELKITPYLYTFLNAQGQDILVLGTDFKALKLSKPFIEARFGSFSLSSFDQSSAFLGIDLAARLISGNKQAKLEDLIGSELELFNPLNSKSTKLKIKGIIHSSDELDSLVIADLAVVQNLSGYFGIHYAQALVDGDFKQVSEKALQLSNDELFAKPISSISLSEGLVLDKLKALMFLIVLVVLIIASTSVNTTLSSIIFSRKKEIALHLALGGSKKDIIKLFALECLVLTLVACIFGVIFGYILANIFGYLIFNASIDFRFKAAFFAVCIAFVFVFFATYFPIKKALKINICENLKGE